MGKQQMQPSDHRAIEALLDLGAHIRALRKSHGYTAVQVAVAAGISRVTLSRLETGEPGVAAGAYAAVLAALGSSLTAIDSQAQHALPSYVHIDEYPVLRSMAWQLREGVLITPAEAWDIYRRHSEILNTSVVDIREARLLRALKRKFGEVSSIA